MMRLLPMISKRRTARGRAFTILELLVAITLTIIMGSIVLGLYLSFWNVYVDTRKRLEFLALLRNVSTDMEMQLNAMVYKAQYWESLSDYFTGGEKPLGPEDKFNVGDAQNVFTGSMAFDYVNPLTNLANRRGFYKFNANQKGGWKLINRGMYQAHFRQNYIGFYYSERENYVHRVEYYFNPSEAIVIQQTSPGVYKAVTIPANLRNGADDDGDSPGSPDGTAAHGYFVDADDDGTLVVRKTPDTMLLYFDTDETFNPNPRRVTEVNVKGDEVPLSGDARLNYVRTVTPGNDPRGALPFLKASTAADYSDGYNNVYFRPRFANLLEDAQNGIVKSDPDYGRALFHGVQDVKFSYIYSVPLRDGTGKIVSIEMRTASQWPTETTLHRKTEVVLKDGTRLAPAGIDLSYLTPPLGINLQLTIDLNGKTLTFSVPILIYSSRWNEYMSKPVDEFL
jgi:type II secretory pathway pseudopilin PulG